MKSKAKILIVAAVLAVLLVAAAIIYPKLAARYEAPVELIAETTEVPTQEPTAAPTEAPTAYPAVVPTEAPTAAPAETPAAEPAVEPAASATAKPVYSLINNAPDFTVYDGDGNPVRLSDHYGEHIVLNFWATWCAPCKSELPAYDAVIKEYGDRVTFMMIDATDGVRETVEGVKAFVEAQGYSFPVYYDSDYSASAAYGAYSIPMTVLIGWNGNVAGSYVGALSEKQLRGGIEALLEKY